MEADSIADFVADYMRRQESPDLGVTKDYRVGDTVDCYVPAWTDPPHVEDLDKILKPSQPLYVENIAHIIGRVQHVQEFSPNEMFSNAHKKYEILDAAGKTHVVDSSEIYAPSQAQVLLRAAEDELTPQQFDLLADHRMSSAQMEEIRFGFKDGLSAEQVALYAHPDMKPSEMDLCRIALQKGLGYPEINNLLKETKELSWSDSRKRLNAKAYGCSGYKNGCDFVIWKTIAGKGITENQVKQLLTQKKTAKIKGFSGKKGKFDAALILKPDGTIGFQF